MLYLSQGWQSCTSASCWLPPLLWHLAWQWQHPDKGHGLIFYPMLQEWDHAFIKFLQTMCFNANIKSRNIDSWCIQQKMYFSLTLLFKHKFQCIEYLKPALHHYIPLWKQCSRHITCRMQLPTIITIYCLPTHCLLCTIKPYSSLTEVRADLRKSTYVMLFCWF